MKLFAFVGIMGTSTLIILLTGNKGCFNIFCFLKKIIWTKKFGI